MTVVGISTVRNEEDVIGTTIDHMMTQVDRLIIADNLSTDATADILQGRANNYPLDVVVDEEPAHYHGRKMTILAAMAVRDYGATWVVPFDADEIWYSPDGRIADVIESQPPWAAIVEARLFNHLPTALDPADGSPQRQMGWRNLEPLPLRKVACRTTVAVTIDEGNHNAHYEICRAEGLEIRHFPYRSAEHFIRKARTGSVSIGLTDLPESTGAHWRDYGRLLDALGEEALATVFHKHFYSDDPKADPKLIYDPAPL